MNKPNVIMILLDGARIDRMVNLQNFKELTGKGTFFPVTITYAPYTIGSMHALFSGAYGYRNGVGSYYSSNNFKKDKFETIASYLKNENYETFADVLNLICIPSKGFDEFVEHNADKDNLIERHKNLLIRMKKIKDNQKNFFVFLHYTKIQNSVKHNVNLKFDNFSKEYFAQKEKNSINYDLYAKTADDYLGKILEEIKRLGLDDSLLIIHSDHGIGIGEKFGERAYGAYCYDYTLKAFVAFCNKNLFPNGKVINEQIRTIDILPTILDYLDIKRSKTSEKIDGISVRDLIEEKERVDRVSFSETGNPYPDPKTPPKEPNVKAVRTNEWKFIRNLWNNNSEELYNLKEDPSEEKNLIDKEIDKAKETRALLDKHIRESLKAKIKDKIK